MSIKVGIVGAAGYVGGELARVLINHPEVHALNMQSESMAGRPIHTTHSDLFFSNLHFSPLLDEDVDVVFLARGHGQSKAYLEENPWVMDKLVIDLSTDYRMASEDNPFVYGLPEWQRSRIAVSKAIANCGCFATAIQLALLPLLRAGVIRHDVHVNGITGSTGAGAGLQPTTHFTSRTGNVSLYKSFRHQHLDEVNQLIGAHQSDYGGKVRFLPMRGNFTRGILITAYTATDKSQGELLDMFMASYDHEPFVHVTSQPIDLKQVVNTNYCLLQVEKIDDQVLVTSCIDNLLKGAAGQAVQNMNICLGLPETTGLQLKAQAF